MENKSLLDNRPTDYEYALLAQHAYNGEAIKINEKVKIGKKSDWRVHSTLHNPKDAYFGVIYQNQVTKQIVLAHRGSNTTQSFLQDAKEIYFNKTEINSQKEDAFAFTQKAVSLLKEENQDEEDVNQYRLSFTGHSLGAFLAELSVYYCHWNFGFKLGEINAVTFESPGCLETLEGINAHHPQGKIDLHRLDIVSYLSYPNLVNTCNRHVGTAYAVQPDLGRWGWLQGNHLLQAHSLNNIIALFEGEEKELVGSYILDWPLGTTVFPGGWSERDYFFKHAEFDKGYYVLPQDDVSKFDVELKQSEVRAQFEQAYKAHYKVDKAWTNQNILPLIHVSPDMSAWLKQFYAELVLYKQMAGEKASPQFMEFAKANQISEALVSHLLIFRLIEVGSIKLLYVDSGQSSIQQFRKSLSALWVNPDQAATLLGFVANANGKRSKTEAVRELEVTGMGKNARISGAMNCPVLTFNVPKNMWKESDETIAKWLKVQKGQIESVKSLGVTKITAMDENATIENAINCPVVVFGVNEIEFSVPEDFFNDVNQLKEHIKSAKEKEYTSIITNNPEVSIQDSSLGGSYYPSPISKPKEIITKGSSTPLVEKESPTKKLN